MSCLRILRITLTGIAFVQAQYSTQTVRISKLDQLIADQRPAAGHTGTSSPTSRIAKLLDPGYTKA